MVVADEDDRSARRIDDTETEVIHEGVGKLDRSDSEWKVVRKQKNRSRCLLVFLRSLYVDL